MRKKVLSILMALSLIASVMPVGNSYNSMVVSDVVKTARAEDTNDMFNPTNVYNKIINKKTEFYEGRPWTDESSGTYTWHGGNDGGRIATRGTGCANFAFRMSDAAFDTVPGRLYYNWEFEYGDVKVGDIIRIKGDSHSVVALQVNEESVVIAEGNYNGTIHWGRILTKADVESATYIITRYPIGFNWNDPTINEPVVQDTPMDGGLTWSLTKGGTLTINGSGSGAMQSWDTLEARPWSNYAETINKIVINEGVTEIGANAFTGVNAYSLKLPKSLRSIGDNAFRGCKNLTTFSLENVQTIGSNAFRSCANLRKLNMPSTLKSIGAGAFFSCTELTSVEFENNENLVTIGDDAFAYCQRLESVNLPKKLDKISARMFSSCTKLGNLIIPDGAVEIGEGVFTSCKSLGVLYIPKSVTKIGHGAVSEAIPLKKVYYSGSSEDWKRIVFTIEDTRRVLNNAEIIYGADISIVEPVKPVNPVDPSPVVDDINTGFYSDDKCTQKAPLDARIHYVNGGNVKQAGSTSKINYKTRVYYTNVVASDIAPKTAKEKKKTGKLVVGITSSKQEPILNAKNKIVDEEAAKVATATISRKKVTVTAKSKAGTVYLWVLDTGDTKSSACARLDIKVAPTKLELFRTDTSRSDFVYNSKAVYKKDSLNLGDTLKLYLYPSYKVGKQYVRTNDSLYSVSVQKNFEEYFSIEADKSDKYCFNVKVKQLKDNKKTSGKVVVTCRENGKSVAFTVQAVNSVKGLSINKLSGLTAVSGSTMPEFEISNSNTANTIGTCDVTTETFGSLPTTDVMKVYAMGKVDGFDKSKFEGGKISITDKPSADQKKLTVKIENKKSLKFTAAKKIPSGTSVYYLIVYNNKAGGYKVINVKVV